MKYFVGIDSGGTKTDCVLVDECGHIVKRQISEGCNRYDHGLEKARDRLIDCITNICACSPLPVSAIYGGIAGRIGCILDFKPLLSHVIGDAPLLLEDDIEIMLVGMLGQVEGCGMVCGTGSSLGVVRKGKPLEVIGGRGYIIDTYGSGFALAKEGLRYAFRSFDGRSPHTSLQDAFENALGVKELHDAVGEIYAGGRRFIASFAHLVFKCYEEGDWAAKKILDFGARNMADMVHTAKRYFEGDFPVVLGGGIARAYPYYVDMIRSYCPECATIILSDTPPVYGSVVKAMALAGIEATEEIKETFCREYSELKQKESKKASEK